MSEMSREYWIDLGRRWVAAGCGWAPGVRWICVREDQCDMTGRVLGAGWVYEQPDLDGVWGPIGGAIPDLRDPPTVGALLAEVREAWGDPEIGVLVNSAGRWDVIRRGLDIRFPIKGWTEAEALVKARESAPREEG